MSVQLQEPSSSQTDLDPDQAEHDYARSGKENDQAKEKLLCCMAGMELIRNHEEAMFTDGIVSKEKIFLPKLEKALLEFGSRDVCQGLFYSTFYTCGEVKIARIIETGCFEGVSADGRCLSMLKAASSSNALLLYELYSKADVRDTAIRMEERYKAISQKRRKSDEPQPHDRRTETFKRHLQLIKPHLENLQASASEGTCLQGGVLLLLKKGNTDGHRDDRYFHSFGVAGKEIVERTLHNFRLQGTLRKHQEEFLKRDFSSDLSLQTQLEALSSVSNNPAMKLPVAYRGKGQLMTSSPSLVQHFSAGYKECHWLPVSLRNRLIYFLTREDNTEVEKLLPFVVASSAADADDADDSSVPPDEDSSSHPVEQPAPSKKRQHSARTRKSTPKQIRHKARKTGDSPAGNMSSLEMTDFQAYSTSLLDSGQILWRIHTPDRDVFVMNSYNAQSGVFQPQEFVQTEICNGSFQCSCEMYKLLQSVSNISNDMLTNVTCLHCRFLKEEVVPIMQRMSSCREWSPATKLDYKLHESRSSTNIRVVFVGSSSGGPVKFSVRGSNDILHFVHLSRHGSFVSCQSSQCAAQSGSKCSVKRLWSVQEDRTLCPHLSVFRAYDEMWRRFARHADVTEGEGDGDVPSDIPNAQNTDDDNQVDDGDDDSRLYFNPVSGLWDFGGLSKHTPTSEIDPKMARNINQRLQFMCSGLTQDHQGFLKGVVLKPVVPETCACGSGYKPVSEADGTNLLPYPEFASGTTLYTRNAAFKCTVVYRKCRGGRCCIHYDPAEDSLHFLTKETCVGDEIGYDFLHKMSTTKTSFTAFCSDMTRIYKSHNPRAAPFVSVPTFVHWWFSWAAAFKIDFRSQQIPSLTGNTDMCEPFKARLQCVKYTGTHLSRSKFNFLKQFMLYQWNKEKTETYQKKIMVAMNGAR